VRLAIEWKTKDEKLVKNTGSCSRKAECIDQHNMIVPVICTISRNFSRLANVTRFPIFPIPYSHCFMLGLIHAPYCPPIVFCSVVIVYALFLAENAILAVIVGTYRSCAVKRAPASLRVLSATAY